MTKEELIFFDNASFVEALGCILQTNNPLLFLHWYMDKKTGLRRLDAHGIPQRHSRFSVFPMVLHPSQSEKYSHMTVVIYDNYYKYLEYFDPVGIQSKYNAELIPTVLVNVLSSKFGLEIKGIETRMCRGEGLQQMQEQEVRNDQLAKKVLGYNIGLCTVWVLLYIQTRVQNEDLTPTEVVDKIKEQGKGIGLTRLITKFTEEFRKYKIGGTNKKETTNG